MRSLLEKKVARSEPREVLSLALKQESDPSTVSLKAARVEAGVILDGAPYPMGLWSLDRRYCVFNSLARELLGYGEDEIRQDAELYLDRNPRGGASFFL